VRLGAPFSVPVQGWFMDQDESHYVDSVCSHCGQKIEFPMEGQGEAAPCPNCGKEITLFVRETPAPTLILPPLYTSLSSFDTKSSVSKSTTVGQQSVAKTPLIVVNWCRVWFYTLMLISIVFWLAATMFGVIFLWFRNPDCSQSEIQQFNDAKIAADSGNRQGQFTLAVCYDEGIGTPLNPTVAAIWYTKAANSGQVLAKSFLGKKYLSGEGVEQNYTEAFRLIEEAANAGETGAQMALASMYEGGVGVKTNLVEAATWYAAAFDSPYESVYKTDFKEEARKKLNELDIALSPDEKTQANANMVMFKVRREVAGTVSPYLGLKVPQEDGSEKRSFIQRYSWIFAMVLFIIGAGVWGKMEEIRYLSTL
jgi:predicted RNA-binding Zn-ribbon protein involved in translation (DUF1610 family)